MEKRDVQVKCSSTVFSSTSVGFVFPTCVPSPIRQFPSPSVSSADAAASFTARSRSKNVTVCPDQGPRTVSIGCHSCSTYV